MAVETTPQQGMKSSSLSTTLLWVVLGLVLLADALDMIDSTVTNIAAPTIVRDIGGGQALIKWLGSSYALAMGVLLVVGGRLGDRFGQRRLFLIGMTGFTAASAVAGLSPGPRPGYWSPCGCCRRLSGTGRWPSTAGVPGCWR